jgi:hypothetical protein
MVTSELLRTLARDSYNRSYILSGLEVFGTKNQPSLLKDKLKGYRNMICNQLRLPKEDFEALDNKKFALKCKELTDLLLQHSTDLTKNHIQEIVTSRKNETLTYIKTNINKVDRNINTILTTKVEELKHNYSTYNSICREYVRAMENTTYLNKLLEFVNDLTTKLNNALHISLANSKMLITPQEVIMNGIKNFNKANLIDLSNPKEPKKLTAKTEINLPKEFKVVGKNFIVKTHILAAMNKFNDYISSNKMIYTSIFDGLLDFNKAVDTLVEIGKKDRHISSNSNLIYTLLPIIINCLTQLLDVHIKKLAIDNVLATNFEVLTK